MGFDYAFHTRSAQHDALQNYLKRTNPKEGTNYLASPERVRTPQEDEIVIEMHHLWKQMGMQIIELIMIRDILRKHSDKRLKAVSNNVNRVTFSLVCQRDMLSTVKGRYRHYAPDQDEAKAINRFLLDIHERMERINRVIIPDNIELTPLKEYAEFIGGWDKFVQEIRKMFYAKKDEMFTEQGNTREPLREYIDSVMTVISGHRLDHAYQERLEKYLEIEEAREEALKAEHFKEKTEYEHNEATHGLMQFSAMFYKCLRKQIENEAIGIGPTSIVNLIGRHGRNGFIILGCKLNQNGKFSYSYISSQGYNTKKLGLGKIFETQEEAEEALNTAQRKSPGMAFTIVDIADEFANLSGAERVV